MPLHLLVISSLAHTWKYQISKYRLFGLQLELGLTLFLHITYDSMYQVCAKLDVTAFGKRCALNYILPHLNCIDNRCYLVTGVHYACTRCALSYILPHLATGVHYMCTRCVLNYILPHLVTGVHYACARCAPN